MDKTMRRVQADWFWPGMTANIRRLVSLCKTCRLSSTETLFQIRTGRGCWQDDPGKCS